MLTSIKCACIKSCCFCFDWVWSLPGVSPEVNELLMEAQLLQVSLPEIQELYQTLLTKPNSAQQTDRSSPVRASSEKVSDRLLGSSTSAAGLRVLVSPRNALVKEIDLSLSQKSVQTVPHNSILQWTDTETIHSSWGVIA